jgi:glycosyltransferase involved in cell wall biosynthesis
MNCRSRILLNDNLVSMNLRGMKRYFRAMIDGVVAALSRNVTVYSPEVRDYGTAKYIHSLQFRGQQPLRLNQTIVSLATRWERAKVLFNAYYTNVFTQAAQVFTVYDMTPELLPQYFDREHPGNRRFMAEKKRCLEQAALVFSISGSTARDAVAYYSQLDPAKIIVTPLGVDTFFFERNAHQTTQQHKPFFLFVGHRMRQKNFARLLTAYKRSGLAKDYDLQVISPGDFTLQETRQIYDLHLVDSIHIFPAANDTALREQYSQATALVYPSEYEGFGLPILEAMASGTLVSTSNISSMPEVGGEVAMYFDPRDPDSIAECLRQIANLSAEQRAERIKRGIARARTFTWARCQQKTVAALQRLL